MHFQNKSPNHRPFQQISDFKDEVIVIVSYFSLCPQLPFFFFLSCLRGISQKHISHCLHCDHSAYPLGIWKPRALNCCSSLLQRGFKCCLVQLQANRDAIIRPTKTFHVQRPYVLRLFKYRMWTAIPSSVYLNIS